MRAECIIEASPAFDDDPGFSERVEDLAIEKLITNAGIEALDVAILPRATRLDVGGLCAHGGDPVLNRLRNELGAIILPDVLRHAPEDEEVGQDVDDVGRLEFPIDPDRPAFCRVLAVPIRNRTRKRLRLALLVQPAGHRPGRLTLRVVADRALRHPQQPRNFALGLSLPHQK
jgi:hypothetical protein